MRKLKLLSLLFAFMASLNADAQAVLENRVFDTGDTSDNFKGYNYESEYNLWKPVDDNNSYTTSYYCTPNWSDQIEPSFNKNRSEYEFTFLHNSYSQWQSQCMIIPDNLKLRAGTKYDVSFIVYGDWNISNASVLICDVDDTDNALTVPQMFPVVSGKKNLIYMSGVNGLTRDCNVKLLLDFGGNVDGTSIDVYNIVIKEHANDDGTVLPDPVPPFNPCQQELVYNSSDNLWKTVDDNNSFKCEYYYAPNWFSIDNPMILKSHSGYFLSLPEATYSQFQAQWRLIPDNLVISGGKKYDMLMEITSNVDLSNVTVGLSRNPYNDQFIMTETINLTANSPYQLRLCSEEAVFKDCTARLFFDFGGNPANTGIMVKDITIMEHIDAVPTAEQTDFVYYVSRTGNGAVVSAIRKVEPNAKVPEKVNIDGTIYPVLGINHYAFNGDFMLNSVEIPNSVIVTGTGLFKNCTGLRQVSLPNSLDEISQIMFEGCERLGSIDIPESVYQIRYGAFRYCSDLKDVTLHDGLGIIGTEAFMSCQSLKEISIPSTVTEIYDNAFSGSGLRNISLSKSLTTIGPRAFFACSSLTSVVIPSCVTEIGVGTFSYCNSLNSMAVEEDNQVYDSRNGCNAIIETATNTLIAGCNGTIIPDDVTGIAEEAFWGCNISSVTIPASVTNIANDAFGCCFYLKDVINYATVPQPIYEGTFLEVPAGATLHVKQGCKSAYEAAEYWNKFNIVEDADVITSISNVEQHTGSNASFNLNGQRVDMPAKGIYIRDGKKYIAR